MSQRQQSGGPVSSPGPALYPAGHVLRANIKKGGLPAAFPFFIPEPKCTLCGWKHHKTRKKQHVVLWLEFYRTNTYRTFCGGSILLLPRFAAGKAAPLSTLETRSSSTFTHGRVGSIAPPVNTLIAHASVSAHSPEPSKTRPHCALFLLKGSSRFVCSNLICSCSVHVASIN